MEERNIPSPLIDILKDYLYVEWIDEELLKNDMKKENWKYDRELFVSQLRESIDNKTIKPLDYFRATGDEYDETEEVVEALQEIWNSLFE